MKYILLLISVIISPIAFSQTVPPPPPLVEQASPTFEQTFTKVDIEASYPGSWTDFLIKNLNARVPIKKNAPAGQYAVIVQFIVDREGNISDIKTLTQHGYGMEEEVIRVLKKSKKWTPAMQNGRKVKAYKKQSITFVVSEK